MFVLNFYFSFPFLYELWIVNVLFYLLVFYSIYERNNKMWDTLMQILNNAILPCATCSATYFP